MRPLNGDHWQGEVGVDDMNFVIFSDIAWGIRAWLIQYHTYITVHQANTLTLFVNRYAPNNENNTAAYISAVSAATGIGADDDMPTDQAAVTAVFRAFTRVEDGASNAGLISDDDIAEAFARLNSSAAGFFLA